MSRLIDADELANHLERSKKVFEKLLERRGSIEDAPSRLAYLNSIKSIEILINLLKDEPTVAPVKHGRWLKTSQENQLRCSMCDRICLIAIYPWYGRQASYCPACGAKMRGV